MTTIDKVDLGVGNARGGNNAAADALELWMRCAEGGADYTMLRFKDPDLAAKIAAAKAGLATAIQILRVWKTEPDWTRWRQQVQNRIVKSAGQLLKTCSDIERSNRAQAWFKRKNNNSITFGWQGTWTKGRGIAVEVDFFDEIQVSLEWDTGTGEPSRYLNLPAMVEPDDRGGGWLAPAA